MTNYKTSELQYYKWADLESCESVTGVCFYKYRNTGQSIQANISRMSENGIAMWTPQYFLLSSDEAKQLTTTMFGQQILSEEGRVMVRSLTNFVAKSSNKRIYLRQLPHPADSLIDYGFFSDDILEIIPLVLKQQGNPIRENNALFAKYREQWKVPIDIFHRVISTEEAIEVFEQFNINKSLITVVPDIQYHHSVMNRFKNGTEPLATYNHNCQKAVYKQEAMWMVFRECICGFNWDEIQNFELRREIIDIMHHMNAPGMIMFTLDSVHVYLRNIKRFPFYSTPEANKPSRKLDYFFTKKSVMSSMSSSEYHKMADTFHLTKYEADRQIPVWKVRVYMAAAWMNQFFGKDYRVLRAHLMEAVRYLVLELKDWFQMQDLLFPDLINVAKKEESPEPKEDPKPNPSTGSQEPSSASASLPEPSETVAAAIPLPWKIPEGPPNGSETSETSGATVPLQTVSKACETIAAAIPLPRKKPASQSNGSKTSETVLKPSEATDPPKMAPVPMPKPSETVTSIPLPWKTPECQSTGSETSDTVLKPSEATSQLETVSKPSVTSSKPTDKVSKLIKTFPKRLGTPGERENTNRSENVSGPSESASMSSGTVSKSTETVTEPTETPGAPEKVSRSSQTISNPPKPPALKSTKTALKPSGAQKIPQPPNSKPSQAPRPKPKPSQAPPPAPTAPSNESKLCDKCHRNGLALNTAKTELAEAQAKANKYETQAKEASEMEKKMKKLRKENEHLQKGIKDLKVEKEKSEGKAEILKNKIDELNGKVIDLEGKLENEQLEKTNFEEESAMLRRNFERLQVHVAKRESKRPNVNRPSTAAPPSCKMSVNDWVKVKEDFESDEVWVVAKKKMIESLLSKTTDPEIRKYCQFELSQYVGSIQLYETIINLNIEKINFTEDTSDLQPLPNYPHLSQKFINLFNEMLKKEAEEVPSDPDNECYICQEAFSDGEKRLFCPTCKKPVHLTCEADWEEAQKKSMIKELSCGHCRGKEAFKDDLEKENKKGEQ
ncbi:hypothetical protein CAEBREN_11981 [Caenorhabditis brenneri]|uniref:RING-type domain-containing protein n=1 Tax=Caenorhabditis brenneri TaxID=135651 RepID=G0MWX6_CAEBE|nr:hypothetical protein CAEBREN_11981 [Caenorhabditis brenneri]